VLYGYFAVCGNHEKSAIFCLCGFIAEADDWNSFNHAWNALLTNSSSNFDAITCLLDKDVFSSSDIFHCQPLLAELSGVLAHSALTPLGAFVVREDFSRLSSTDRAVLAAEGIESPLDVIFYDLVEQTIRRAHEESEKISLLISRESHSAAEQYHKIFAKHLGHYLLGTHLMGAPTFSDAQSCSYLQAATLLGKAVVLIETQQLSWKKEGFPLFIPPALQKMITAIAEQGRFHAEALHMLAERLKKPYR
jgi:hypothetical protein